MRSPNHHAEGRSARSASRRVEHAGDLRLAALDPDLGPVLAQYGLVDEADRLVGKAGRQRADLQGAPPLRSERRDHRLLLAGQFIEIIEDGGALDHHLAIVEHQGRNARQRVIGGDLCGIAEHRPGPVFERDPVEMQGDRDATDEGRVILADEDQGGAPEVCPSMQRGGRDWEEDPRQSQRVFNCGDSQISAGSIARCQ